MKRPDPVVICDPKAPGTILTEQEHIQSTSADWMLKTAARGGKIRISQNNQYGVDQFYGNKTEVLLEKQRLEKELDAIAAREKINPQDLKKDPVKTLKSHHLRKKQEAQADHADKKSASPQPQGADSQLPLKTPNSPGQSVKNDQTNQAPAPGEKT